MAQTNRPLSPDGVASAHVQGEWVKPERTTPATGGERYQGGRWIDITYGRPLLRGREAFAGTGDGYARAACAGAPVWRAGANRSTRLDTEVPLVINGTVVPAGAYSLFIDLQQPAEWTFIVSGWAQAQRFGAPISEGLYGAFDDTPEKDVVRALVRPRRGVVSPSMGRSPAPPAAPFG